MLLLGKRLRRLAKSDDHQNAFENLRFGILRSGDDFLVFSCLKLKKEAQVSKNYRAAE